MISARELAIRWRVRLGYPLAVACLWLAQPTLLSLAWGGAIGLAGLLVRGAAAGHLRKHEELATGGPYAFTRNPLYLGSALLAAGFLVAGRSWIAAILVTIYFAAFYGTVMRGEEAELRARYGKVFEEYAARVPLFRPRLGGGKATGQHFSWATYARNREYQAALGFAAVLVFLFLKIRFGW